MNEKVIVKSNIMKKLNLKLFLLALVIIVSSCQDEEAPVPVATATPASQIITSGQTTAIALSGSIEGTTFTWTVVQEGVTGATAGSGSTIAQTLTSTGTVAGTATYTIVPMAGGVQGNPITVLVTVNLVKITYNANVKALFVASCTPCHVAGGTQPKKFDDYTTAKNNITTILDRVKREPGATGFMPRNGAKLAADKIALLEKWLADGTPEN